MLVNDWFIDWYIDVKWYICIYVFEVIYYCIIVLKFIKVLIELIDC